MLNLLPYFKSTFDLFTSPFVIVGLEGHDFNKSKCIFYNNAFNIEFMESGAYDNPNEITDLILQHINFKTLTKNKKYNLVLNFNNPKNRNSFYRISFISNEEYVFSITLESLSRLNDPSWNSILLNNSAIVYSTKPDGDYAFKFISDNVADILGFESSRFVKANDFWDSLIEPNYKNYVVNSLRCLESSNEVRMIYPLRNHDGIYRWFEERAKLVRKQDGSPDEIIGMVIDINEQKLSYDNLEKTLEELKTILNTIPGIIIVLDRQFKILNYSDSALKIFPDKYEQDIRGYKLDELLSDDLIDMQNDIAKCIHNKYSFNRITNQIETKYFNGSFNILINPISSENGDVWGAVVAMFGVSSFVEKENQLNKLIRSLKDSQNAELEQTKKVKSLLNEIEQSRSELIESNAQKDKFFSIIAHDLRTPLKGFMQLTKILSSEFEDMDSEEILDMTNSMYESSQNIYKLLENLLEWSKIQQGIIHYSPLTMQLSTLVMMNIDLMLPSAKQKGILLVNQVPNDVLIFTDVNILNTIIRNLISNALKFSYPNTEIIISSVFVNEDCVEICIRDFGIGMSDEIKNKLFKLETHITSKGTCDESGSGLGLILCKELVSINGGEMRVESNVNEGTGFYFTVPAKSHNNF